MNGLSILICCYNSENIIERTLKCAASQKGASGFSWEVVLVDNNSSDNTIEKAKSLWQSLGSPVPLKIVSEKKQGLAFARHTGILNCRCEIVSFVDDDNFISENWAAACYKFMSEHPDCGACGGKNTPEYEKEIESTLKEFQSDLALGEQGRSAIEDVTSSRGYLWGAGLTIRKSLYTKLVEGGFSPALSGRLGGRMLAGEDWELCFLIKTAGRKLYYNAAQQLIHLVNEKKCNADYYYRLSYGFGLSFIWFDVYQRVYKTGAAPGFGFWLRQMNSAVRKYFAGMMKSYPSAIEKKYRQNYLAGFVRGLFLFFSQYNEKSRQIHFNVTLAKKIANENSL